MNRGRTHPYPVREIEHCAIRVRDGIELSARLWLPAAREGRPVPAVLEYIPYRKRDLVRIRDERNHPYFARHGYACVRVDMRGSGDSQGALSDMYGRDELDDAIDVIDWIAAQDWCNGAVGMMGTSWGGTSALQAAARRPPALRAIIAVCATNNRFDDDIHHMGGCLLTDTVEWGATLPAILAAPPDPQAAGPDWRRMWLERLEGIGFALEHWVRHETRDGYWRWGAVNETPGAIQCPVLAIGGWADRYSNTVMNLLAEGHERCFGIVGPWGHHYPDAASPGPGIGFQQVALAWWDRWLAGMDNGIDAEPRLRVWRREYDTPGDRLEIAAGGWVSEPTWPSGEIAPRKLWLGSGRLDDAASPAPRRSAVPATLEVGIAAGDSGYFGRSGGLALAQQVEDANSLVFDTDPLDEPLEILGSVRLRVSIESDRPIATLVARLNDVPPSGDVARVTYAIRNMALDERAETAEPLLPGKARPLAIDFPNAAYRFAKGHRVRLALSSAYWPLIWPAPSLARITLHHAGALLTLPVRPARTDGPPVELPEPMLAGGHEACVVSDPPLERGTADDAATGRREVAWHQPRRHLRFPATGQQLEIETHASHTLTRHDPTSAHTRFTHELRVSRGDWAVEIVSIAALRSTATHFHPSGSLTVRENGVVVFQRRWNPVLSRTCS